MRIAVLVATLLGACVLGGCGGEFFSGSPGADAGDAGAEASTDGATGDGATGDETAQLDAPSRDDAPGDAPCTGAQSDPQNCGRCGHDCLGGACMGGACQPVALSSADAYPTSLVAYDRSGGRVEAYWAQEGAVGVGALERCVFGPGSAACMPSAFAASTRPRGLIGAGLKLRWFDLQGAQPAILAADPACASPCTPVVETPTATPILGGSMAAGGSDVFWTDDGPPGAGHLYGSPDTQGNTPQTLVSNTPSYPTPTALEPDAIDFVVGGDLVQCPLSLGPCTPTTLVSLPGTALPNAPLALAVHGGTLYWTSPSDNAIGSCTPSDCQATMKVVARGLGVPWGLAVDDSGVYWTERGDPNATCQGVGGVAMCPLAGCPASGPTYLATGQSCPTAIAVTSSAVVWANSGSVATPNGAIKALAWP